MEWKIAPSEFWNMTPRDFWLLFDYSAPRDPRVDYAGTLTESDVEELYQCLMTT
jgi:hypothetical protein